MPNTWSCIALICVGALGCDHDGPDSAPPDACRDTVAREAIDYVPPDARGIASLQVDEFVAWEREIAGASALQEAGMEWALDAMAACGTGLDDIDAVTVAAGWSERELLVAIEGESVGDESRLRCLMDELGFDWTVERHGCDVRFVAAGDTVGFVAAPDMVVVAMPAWIGHARAVSLGARPTPPRKLVREIQDRRTLSFGGDLVDYRDELHGLPLVGGLQTVVGWVDLDRGFELEVEGTYDTREAAAAVAHELEALRRRGRILAPEIGIPPRLLDRVGVKQRGRDVEVTIDLSKSDVRRIADALAGRRA